MLRSDVEFLIFPSSTNEGSLTITLPYLPFADTVYFTVWGNVFDMFFISFTSGSLGKSFLLRPWQVSLGGPLALMTVPSLPCCPSAHFHCSIQFTSMLRALKHKQTTTTKPKTTTLVIFRTRTAKKQNCKDIQGISGCEECKLCVLLFLFIPIRFYILPIIRYFFLPEINPKLTQEVGFYASLLLHFSHIASPPSPSLLWSTQSLEQTYFRFTDCPTVLQSEILSTPTHPSATDLLHNLPFPWSA